MRKIENFYVMMVALMKNPNFCTAYQCEREYLVRRTLDCHVFVYNISENSFCEARREKENVKGLYSFVRDVNYEEKLFMIKVFKSCIIIQLSAIGGRWQRQAATWEEAASRLTENGVPLCLVKRAVRRAYPLDAKRLDEVAAHDWRSPTVVNVCYKNDPPLYARLVQLSLADSDVLPSSFSDETADNLASSGVVFHAYAGNGLSFASIPKGMRKRVAKDPTIIYLQVKSPEDAWKTRFQILLLGDNPWIISV